MENTKIGWTNHTFNPVIGCAKTSSLACTNCYAETYANRYGHAKWGLKGTRHITSEANRKKPFKWNKEAKENGIRSRVFCSSLSDIFEDYDEIIGMTDERKQELNAVRQETFETIENTPYLDWMLLTKRPENFSKFFPRKWLTPQSKENGEINYIPFPKNIWLGISLADQKDYDLMFNVLREFCSKHYVNVMFVSCEPLIGKIDFFTPYKINYYGYLKPLDLVIIGGESGVGHKIRRFDIENAKFIFDQFKDSREISGLPKIFFKQVGSIVAKELNLDDKKGETIEQYPTELDWLKVQELPNQNIC